MGSVPAQYQLVSASFKCGATRTQSRKVSLRVQETASSVPLERFRRTRGLTETAARWTEGVNNKYKVGVRSNVHWPLACMAAATIMRLPGGPPRAHSCMVPYPPAFTSLVVKILSNASAVVHIQKTVDRGECSTSVHAASPTAHGLFRTSGVPHENYHDEPRILYNCSKARSARPRSAAAGSVRQGLVQSVVEKGSR